MLGLKNIRAYLLSTVLLSIILLSSEARAELFGFSAITANSDDPATLAMQLSVEVTDATWTDGDGVVHNQALFTFYNDGPTDSIYDVDSPLGGSITEIYFDDGTLLGTPTIINTAGVNFINGADPSELPGGNSLTPKFEETVIFSAESDPEAPINGVNSGEYVGLLFDISSDFQGLLAAIDLGFNDPEALGALRIGIHLRGIPYDGTTTSDSFIMTPVPGAAILGLLGLGIVGIKLRKFA